MFGRRFSAAAIALLLSAAVHAQKVSGSGIVYPLDLPARMSPRAAVSSLVGVTATPGGKLVAVGQRGHILLSDDKGANWTQAKVPVSSDLVAVQFPSAKVGWAVGHDGLVLKTVDSGATWEVVLTGRSYGNLLVEFYERAVAAGQHNLKTALEQARRFREEGPDKPFLDVWFENDNSGWIVGAFNLILKTDDGGVSWIPWIDRTQNEMEYTLFSIRNIAGELYISGELGLLLRLNREKQVFTEVKTSYPGTFFGVTGNNRLLVAYGLRGNALSSADRGKSWQQLNTGLAGGVVDGAYLADGRLVLASADGQVVLSEDEGKTFRRVEYPASTSLSSFVPISRNSLLAVGAKGTRAFPLP